MSAHAAAATAAASALRAVRPFSEIPGPSPSIPLIGNSWQYFKFVGRYELKKMHDASFDKFNRYGAIVREEYEWRRPVVHLFDPVDFEKIFRSKEKCPVRPASEFVRHYRHQNPDRYPTVGMAHSQGEEWYRERQRIAPILLSTASRPGVPENHIPKQNDICNEFIAYLSRRKNIDHVIPDVRDATNRLALESICSLCLGMRTGILSTSSDSSAADSTDDCSSTGSHLISLTTKLFNSYNRLYYGLPTWKLYRSSTYAEFGDVEDALYNMTMRFIQDRDQEEHDETNRRASSQQEERADSVLEVLSRLPNFDPRHIPITVSDFIAGGTFTVANSLTYLIQNLACNPRVQESIYEELLAAGLPDRSKGRQMSANDLSHMPYLKAAVKESFRMTSTIPAIVRILAADTVLSGYHVPKGTKVFCHFLVTCQMEKYFPDASSFKPERWMGRSRQEINPFASMPFGTGPRMCIGRRFAEHQLHIAVAKLVLNFRLEARQEKLFRSHEFIVVPSHPVPIRFVPRSLL